MLKCWSYKGYNRPKFREIYESLSQNTEKQEKVRVFIPPPPRMQKHIIILFPDEQGWKTYWTMEKFLSSTGNISSSHW